jgi:hypothetical protein
VLEALVRVEFVRHPQAGELLVEHDALIKGHQLVVDAVQEAEGRQPFQMENRTELVIWVAIDNTTAVWPLALCYRSEERMGTRGVMSDRRTAYLRINRRSIRRARLQ